MALQRLATLQVAQHADASVVAAAVLPLDTMTTMELWRYSAHLSDQEQAAEATRSDSGRKPCTRWPAW
jgi:lipopolysaccharide export system permease protein